MYILLHTGVIWYFEPLKNRPWVQYYGILTPGSNFCHCITHISYCIFNEQIRISSYLPQFSPCLTVNDIDVSKHEIKFV
jgi:hypothetical protein